MAHPTSWALNRERRSLFTIRCHVLFLLRPAKQRRRRRTWSRAPPSHSQSVNKATQSIWTTLLLDAFRPPKFFFFCCLVCMCLLSPSLSVGDVAFVSVSRRIGHQDRAGSSINRSKPVGFLYLSLSLSPLRFSSSSSSSSSTKEPLIPNRCFSLLLLLFLLLLLLLFVSSLVVVVWWWYLKSSSWSISLPIIVSHSVAFPVGKTWWSPLFHSDYVVVVSITYWQKKVAGTYLCMDGQGYFLIPLSISSSSSSSSFIFVDLFWRMQMTIGSAPALSRGQRRSLGRTRTHQRSWSTLCRPILLFFCIPDFCIQLEVKKREKKKKKKNSFGGAPLIPIWRVQRERAALSSPPRITNSPSCVFPFFGAGKKEKKKNKDGQR